MPYVVNAGPHQFIQDIRIHFGTGLEGEREREREREAVRHSERHVERERQRYAQRDR